MVRIVGATLVVALVGSHWMNAPGRLGAHKGRPYTSVWRRCVTSMTEMGR